MDRNSIFGLVIIFLILIGYSIWMSPSEEELQQRKHKSDSIAQVQQDQLDSVRKAEAAKINKPDSGVAISGQTLSAVSDSGAEVSQANSLLKEKYGIYAGSVKQENKYYIIENDVIKLKISEKGGSLVSAELKQYKTFDTLPVYLFKSDTAVLGFNFFVNNRSLNTTQLSFHPYWNNKSLQGKDSLYVSGTDSLEFSMRLYPDAADSGFVTGKYIEFHYVIHGNEYMSGLDIRLQNMNDILAANANYINLDWNMNLRQQEMSLENEKLVSTIYYKYLSDDVDYLSERKDEQKQLNTKVKWISFKQQFFTTTLIARESFGSAEIQTYSEGKGERYLKSMSAVITLPFDPMQTSTNIPMNLYLGPNKFKAYRAYGLDLEKQIPIGWSFFLMAWINRYAVIPVFDFLSTFNLNYGIIILILTVLLKIVLFPIAYKTYMSSAKMRVLKPEIDEIGAKFPKKEDAMKKQQATMDLYKRAGINPMAGCIPLLLQMPILIAMFRFFPASIELRQQSFLWAHDLSSYDSILDLPFTIPFYGDHVSLFTLLMTISTIIYTKMSNDMMASGTQQLPGMKTVMYLMPIMFLGFFNSYASGLSYYYLLANLFTFAQMYAFRKLVNEDKIHLQIQENKKKPVKKSGFQKRLEDMAKKQGYNPKR